MRPFGPEPLTRARSTPSSRANLRTEGLACGIVPGTGADAPKTGSVRPTAGAAGALAGAAASTRAGLAAGLAPHFLYHARGGRGNFHRCLVRFHADKRLLRLYRIARLDQDFDDVDVLEVADVGYENLSRGSHALCASGVTTGAGDLSPGRPAPSPDQTVTGLGFSGSIRYFLIASETILDLISP